MNLNSVLSLNDKDFGIFMEKSRKQEINQVQMDALVLLKMMKHCSENELNVVSGQLLGLNFENSLEVTNCYPMIQEEVKEEETNEDDQKYQLKMYQCLQDLNVDQNIVGWYQSSDFESHLDLGMIDAQYNYQLDYGKRCVCILLEPSQTNKGRLKMKAIRLTDNFMELLKESYKTSTGIQITQDLLSKHKLTNEQMFEQVPIKINSSKFLQILSYDWELNIDGMNSLDFENLDLSTNSFLDKSLENLSALTDYLYQEQGKFLYYQRKVAQQKQYMAKKKTEEKEVELKNIQQPTRIESLIISNQILNSQQEINDFSENLLKKLELLK